jgi:hypothetical protein
MLSLGQVHSLLHESQAQGNRLKTAAQTQYSQSIPKNCDIYFTRAFNFRKTKELAGRKESLPIEITQSSGNVAEVRFVCDSCKEMIGTRLMLRKEAEAQMKTKVICQKCRKTQRPDK